MFQIATDRAVLSARPVAFVPSPHHGGRIRPRRSPPPESPTAFLDGAARI
jgi:hypothetical protein